MKKITIIGLIGMLMLISSCGKKEGVARSMEQLHQTQGIPVKVQTVALQTFSRELAYSAALSGIDESYGQAMLAESIASVNAKIGDRVSKGQVIVTYPRSTPSVQYNQASTGLDATRQAYNRMKNLFNQGAISRQDLDNVETQYKLAQANVNTCEELINIRAPISGILTTLSVSPGERSYPGQILFTVSSANGYKAKLMVPDKEARSLQVGTPATATWSDVELSGKVTKVSLALDPYMKAVPVEVSFPATQDRISFGSTARIKLNTMTKGDAVVVNREYIVTKDKQTYVWVNVNNRATMRQITTGMDNQLQFEVLSGLVPGDKLIVEGLNLLSENAPLKILE